MRLPELVVLRLRRTPKTNLERLLAPLSDNNVLGAPCLARI